MYIECIRDISFHWWGKIILAINSGDGKIIIFEEVETYLFEYIACKIKVSEIIKKISAVEDIEESEVGGFIDRFLQKYNDIFFLSDVKPECICASGEKGYYYPTEIHISLTNRCNLRCLHCYKNAEKQGVNLKSDEIIRFLAKFENIVPNVTISGGEPLLHPDFEKLLSWISERFNVALLTAGNVQDKELLQNTNKVRRGVALSIYSSQSKRHDAFTSIKGSWERTIDTLRYLINEGIEVSVTTLLSKDNYDDIVELISFLKEEGVNSITVGRVMPVGRGKDNYTVCADEIYEQMRVLKEKYSVTLAEEHDIKASSKLFKPFNCVAGSLLWAIFEDGDIYPCAVNKIEMLKMGNINDTNFEILRDRRRYIDKISKLECMQKTNSLEKICPFEGA